MAFAAQSLCEVMHAFNMRSRQSIFRIGPFSNRKLTLCAFICISLQLAVMTIPPLAGLFNVVAMNGMQWLTVAALSLTPIVVLEFGKLLSSIGRKRKKSKIL